MSQTISDFCAGMVWDIRYALRMLRKSPGFTAAAVLTLALGIGAATGIFSVVDGALIRALPFRAPSRLAALFQTPGKMTGPIGWAADGPDILDWQRGGRAFSSIAASLLDSANLTGARLAQHVNGERVTANYFELLGVQAAIGRRFSTADERPGRSEVVVSYALWRTAFGGQAILGRTLGLDGRPFTVIGIMPAVYHDPRTWSNPQSQYWILLSPSQLAAHRGDHMYASFGRLAPGVTLAQAQQELNLAAARDAKAFPGTNRGMGALVSPLQQVNLQTYEGGRFESVGPALLLPQFAAAFLLLIACANVANLMFSQALVRRREFAVRAAMGAGRARIVRQLLTESVLLAMLAGAGGVLLAHWCTTILLALAPAGYLPPTAEVHLDARVLGFAVGVAALTGILFGLLPALRAAGRNLNEDLKATRSSSGNAPSRRLAGRSLVVFELAATFVLLAGGGLLVRSLASLLAVNPGFNPKNFYAAGLSLPARQYAQPEQIMRFFSAVQQRASALPGVEAAAFTSAPEFGVTSSSPVAIAAGSSQTPGARDVFSQICIVTPGFFRAAGIPMLRGRDFAASDLTASARVAIVSEAFARHFWPSQDALGHRLDLGPKDQPEIVGVAGDVRQNGMAASSLPEIYFPLARDAAEGTNAMSIVVRSALSPAALTREIGEQAAAIDPGIPLAEPRTGRQILEGWSGYLRYRATLLASFAAMALLIAVIGLFGTISYSAAQRTREIGLRMAVGAQPQDIFRLILLQGAKLTLIGLAIGLIGGLALTRLMAGLLFGVKAADPVTFAGVAMLLATVALLACYIPARRAMRVEPTAALRDE
ncbi:MAG: ABC transporter permease [Terriglobales bacterium]